MRRGRAAGALAVLAIVVGTAAGCASPNVAEGGCVPRMSVEPRSARVGDTIVFSTRDVCDVDVPSRGWRVEARASGDDTTRATASSSEPFDGSWSVRVVIPSGFSTGEATVGITNWDYSSCPDGASCAGPFAGFTVKR